eukprot:4393572-Amphidinium_carterae.3
MGAPKWHARDCRCQGDSEWHTCELVEQGKMKMKSLWLSGGYSSRMSRKRRPHRQGCGKYSMGKEGNDAHCRWFYLALSKGAQAPLHGGNQMA